MGNIISIESPTLTSYQKRILYNEHRFTATEACTKSGKTFSHMWWLFEIAHGLNPQYYTDSVKAGMYFWWVAPVYSQAEIAYNRMKIWILNVPGYQTNDTKRTIKTPLGTIIVFKTADKPDNLYGEDVYAAVFDEFTRSKRSSWVALRSTLTATKAPCKLIGNFIDNYNWGHLMVKNDKKGVFDYHRITAYDAADEGIIDYEEIESAKDTLTESEFNKLYMAQGEGDNAIITLDDILNLWTNKGLDGPNRMIVDIAGTGEDDLIVIIMKGLSLIHYEIHKITNGKDVVDIMKRLSRKFRVSNDNIIFDAVGVGHAATGWFKGAYEFRSNFKPLSTRKVDSGPGKKTEVSSFETLRDECAFKLGEVISKAVMSFDVGMPYEVQEDIQMQLGQLRSGDSKRGLRKIIPKSEIKDNIGKSPDWMDVFIMAMVPYVSKKKPKRKTLRKSIKSGF